MRKIKGNVTCSENRPINKDAVAIVSVIDTSLACGPSLTVGKQEIRNLTSFPFSFEVEYNEQPSDDRYTGRFALSVRIETNRALNFINDTHFSLLDDETNELKNSIDVFVIPV